MPDGKRSTRTIEEQLDEIRAQIHEIVTRLESAAGKEAEALKPKLKAAQERLNELRHTSHEAWGDLKPGLEKAWDELQRSFTQAASRFKSRPKE
jgi:predicted  nucleic acid-binding Zn-ribbon protein